MARTEAARVPRMLTRHALWLAPIAIFAAGGILEGLHAWVGYNLSGRPLFGFTLRGQSVSLAGMLARTLPSWLVAGVMAALVVRVARRFPLFAASWRRALLVHLPAAVVFCAGFLTAACVFRWVLFLRAETGIAFSTALIRYYAVYFNTFFFYYWGIAGVVSAFVYERDLRHRELLAERLRSSLGEARLEALQRQLEPHFLFNALNIVSSLAAAGDRDGTVRVVALIGDLLRRTLDCNEPVVPLHEDLELLDLYLSIQRFRYDDRLTFEVIADPALLRADTPSLLLQPLVENAIRHGIAPAGRPGRIEVRVARADHRVRATVADTGVGLRRAQDRSTGTGLRNLRARLQHLYGSDYALALADCPQGGAIATVEWPLEAPALRVSA